MDRRTICTALLGATIMPFVGGCGASRAASGGQAPRPDLYQCEGCEAVRERDAAGLDWQAELATPDEPGERLHLSGTVLHADGKTPAAEVVIYAHQTNAAGLYANGSNETALSREHGRLRAWVKTGPDGRYSFRTIKPGPYPDRAFPAHIHLVILEPGRPPYWIDDVVFVGEFGVTRDYTRKQINQGGSGLVRLKRSAGGLLEARRDIILEVHPPGR